MAQIYNKGRRTFNELFKGAKSLPPGGRIEASKENAEKFAKAYPKDLEYILAESDKIKISKHIRELIKEVNGKGVKTFSAMFEEQGLTDDDSQLELVMSYLEKQQLKGAE